MMYLMYLISLLLEMKLDNQATSLNQVMISPKKELLAADELMKDIKNYSLETGQSVKELLQQYNETVTDSYDEDDDGDEEPPKEVVALEAKFTADKANSPNKPTTVPAKPEAVSPNEATTCQQSQDQMRQCHQRRMSLVSLRQQSQYQISQCHETRMSLVSLLWLCH